MEHLVGTAGERRVALCDIALDVGAHAAARKPRPVQQVGEIDVRLPNGGDGDLRPALRAAFHDRVP